MDHWTIEGHVEIGSDLIIRVNQPDPEKYPGELIIEADTFAEGIDAGVYTRKYRGSSQLRIGFGYDITTEAVNNVDRMIESLHEIRTRLLSGLAKRGVAPPLRLAIVAEGPLQRAVREIESLAADEDEGNTEGPTTPAGDPTDSPSYRADMTDAGRGHLLG